MSSSSVVARIQAVPARAHLAEALKESLAPLPTEIIYDEEAVADPNPWRGYRLCLTDLPDCTHLLVVQDDVVVCQNFAEAVARIAASIEVPACLFTPGGRVVGNTIGAYWQAAKYRRHYVELAFRDLMPAVALLWPAGLIPSVLEYAVRFPNLKDGRPAASDDAKLGEWKRATKQRVLLTVPSLVEHPDTELSVIHPRRTNEGRDRGRVATLYIKGGDPLDIDW